MAIQDLFSSFSRSLTSPAEDGFAIDPSVSEDLPRVTRAIYVGADGDLDVETVRGAELSFKGLVAGAIVPVRAAKVKDTSTASELIGLL